MAYSNKHMRVNRRAHKPLVETRTTYVPLSQYIFEWFGFGSSNEKLKETEKEHKGLMEDSVYDRAFKWDDRFVDLVKNLKDEDLEGVYSKIKMEKKFNELLPNDKMSDDELFALVKEKGILWVRYMDQKYGLFLIKSNKAKKILKSIPLEWAEEEYRTSYLKSKSKRELNKEYQKYGDVKN